MTRNEKVLWQIWGEFYEYPKCCMEAFIGEGSARGKKGVWSGSGFVPCLKCADKLAGKDKEHFISWLGRDPSTKVDISNTIREASSESWTKLADKYQYDQKYYIGYLNKWRGEIK